MDHVRVTKGTRFGFHWTLKSGGRGLPRWLGVVFIIAGCLLILALARYQVRLALFGTHAEGEVIAFERTRGLRGRSAPRVRFVSERGQVEEFRGASMRPSPVKVGDRVRVLYVEGDPIFAEIDSWRTLWLGIWVEGGLSLAMLASGPLSSGPLGGERPKARMGPNPKC